MSHAWRTLAATLTTVLLTAGTSFGVLALAGAATASPVVPNPHFVRLQVDSITPSVVTSTAADRVTAQGSVINDGDRDVSNLQVRLERAPMVQNETELRTALRSVPTEPAILGSFTTVSAKLSPGQSVPFSLSLPLSGTTANSLALTQPGVYPMLVNVNGEPDFGGRARLDVAQFLLPVLSLPPAAQTPGTAAPPAVRVPTAATGMTVLWPLADRPRLLPGALGTPTVLGDDELARSFADGGRLDGLLRAVQQRTTPAADPTGALADSLCLGVDPDLLVTAVDMTRGYEVAAGNGSRVLGTGGPAAGAWLDRLRATSKGRCVVALPWAQADVNALARSSLPDLERAAIDAGRDVVAKTLGLPALADVVWPDGGFLAERTATELAALGAKTTLVSSDGITTTGGSALPLTTRTARLDAGGNSLGVALIDAPSATALAATGSGDQRHLRLQDALGAIAWPAIGTGGTSAGRPSSVLLAPPQRWEIGGSQAQTMLGELSTLLQAGAATALPLPTLLAQANSSTTTTQLDYPVQAASSEIPARTTTAISTVAADVDRFAAALQRDPQSGTSPDDLLAPLRLGMLRGASTASSTTRDGAAGDPQVQAVRQELDQLHHAVALQAPSGTYTLASAQSPLLLVVHNDLPVSVNVRLTVDAPAGLRATDIGVQQLPAHSSRQLQVPTSVRRTGQFAVDVALSTDNGQRLGETTRLQVRSTAYGPATALATAGAALVLLVLVARRLWHRFRGQPDRADEQRMVHR